MNWFALAVARPTGASDNQQGKWNLAARTQESESPPIAVRLIRDSNFEELEHYWHFHEGDFADGPPPAFPPDCILIASLPLSLAVSTAFQEGSSAI